MQSESLSQSEALEWLKPVQDPELHMSLVELGLIYKFEFLGDGHCRIEMTLTSPTCPAAGYLVEQVKQRILENEKIRSADVELVFEPKWDPASMASEEAKEVLGLW